MQETASLSRIRPGKNPREFFDEAEMNDLAESIHDILVDLDAEGMSDLLGDAHTAKLGIAPLHLDDGSDEFRARTFGSGFAAMRRGGKEQAIFAIHQGIVEPEQSCRLDERAKLRNPGAGSLTACSDRARSDRAWSDSARAAWIDY